MKNILLVICCIALIVYMLLFVYATFKNRQTTLMAKTGALISIGFTFVYLYLLVLEDTHILFLISSFIALHLTSILNGYAVNEKLNIKHHFIKLLISIGFILLFIILS